MGMIKERVIGFVYVMFELSIGEIHCLLNMNSWLLIDGIGSRMCVGMRDSVEKTAGLTQTGDMHYNAGSVFEGLGRFISTQSKLP